MGDIFVQSIACVALKGAAQVVFIDEKLFADSVLINIFRKVVIDIVDDLPDLTIAMIAVRAFPVNVLTSFI